MSVLHILRDPADPRALPVIQAQAASGVRLTVLCLGSGNKPLTGAAMFTVEDAAVPGLRSLGWTEALEMIFGADTVVTW